MKNQALRDNSLILIFIFLAGDGADILRCRISLLPNFLAGLVLEYSQVYKYADSAIRDCFVIAYDIGPRSLRKNDVSSLSPQSCITLRNIEFLFSFVEDI